jgi:2-oxoglutarate dehydrogenase E1 component
MENEWEGFVQVTDTQMLEKVDTSHQRRLGDLFKNAVGNLPSDKFINKTLADRKNHVFETDKLDWAMARTFAYGSL